MKILHIKSSILANNSVSSVYGDKIIKKLNTDNNHVIVRDVVANPVTQLTAESLNQIGQKSGPIYNEYLSLINELKSVDTIVLSSPMYNFSISNQLHAYFDALAINGETFHYEKDGTQVGHLTGKKAYVILSRGGKYSSNGITFQEDYIKMFLNFLGIKDIKFIFIEGSAMGLSKNDLDQQFDLQS